MNEPIILTTGVPTTQTAPVMQQVPPKMFVDEVVTPTQAGPEGIRYDFNNGCRVEVPQLSHDQGWRIRLSDLDTGNVIYEVFLAGGAIQSTKKYFIPFKIEVFKNEALVFIHSLSLKDQKVLVQLPVGTLGDSLAWFPYVASFQQKHGSKLTCGMSELMIPLFKDAYPELEIVPLSLVDTRSFYATYRIGLFFDDWDCVYQPVDFRYAGLHKTAAYILGVEPHEAPAKIVIHKRERVIKEPYVCIAVQSSTQCKYWNQPGGWIEVVKYLKAAGYRVLCIDKDATWGRHYTWTSIPHGAEDMTGALPLAERAELLMHADFFIGLSSGLAWLAWSVGVPVVMISGFTHPRNEFYTPYRVINYHTCNSCWNDPRHIFDHFDFFWCPRHKGTERQFECTRLITADHVKRTIQQIPAFKGINVSVEHKRI